MHHVNYNIGYNHFNTITCNVGNTLLQTYITVISVTEKQTDLKLLYLSL